MPTLKLQGTTDDRPSQPVLGRGLPANAITVKAAVRLEFARAGGQEISLRGLHDDDVIEIELQDGLRLWTRVGDAAKDFGLPQSREAREDGDEEVIELQPLLAVGGPSRGLGEWAIKGLKVLGINLDQKITSLISDHVEGALKPGPGLYRCSETDPDGLKPPTRIKGGPVLLFLHGTASSTSGSFSGLWTGSGKAPIQRLFAKYEGRVLAFQHESLTRSPIQNALDLVKQLNKIVDKKTEIHLISHSRGGMIGELLARGMRTGAAAFTAEDFALFAKRPDLDALKALSQALGASEFQITCFVRVACPARGTTLADGRLDRYFSMLVNLASLIPALGQSVVFDGLTTLLAGVLKQRTDPSQLPGLEAMMPTSPLVRMLNNPEVLTTADLHVLGGDLAPAGVFGRLKTLATDLYYRDDHDLVVNTPAMFGGAERKAPIKYWIDTGGEVTHFNYFSRSDTAERLVNVLTTGGGDFRTLEASPSAVTSADYRKRGAGAQPTVFVVPGLMGSELTAGGDAVWMHASRLAIGGLNKLRIKTPRVVATGLVASGYAELCDFLASTHDVVPFPYDWRQPIDQAASELQTAIEEVLDKEAAQPQPIRIVAHSMGGMVVMAMLASAKGKKIWDRACEIPGSRLVMLGTPLRGSHAIGAMLLGRDSLVKKLALLDVTADHQGLLSTIADFEGLLNLLPHDGSLDLYTAEAWDRLFANDTPPARGLSASKVESSTSAKFAWTKPAAAALSRARGLRDRIRQVDLKTAHLVYLAGSAPETASDIQIDDKGEYPHKVKVLATAHGDGRVPWKTGIPPEIRTFYSNAAHGDLANTSEEFPGILDLLNAGTTSKLSTIPPARARSISDSFEMSDPLPSMIPDDEELAASALGGRRARRGRQRDTEEAPQVKVRVVHDNLTNATSPVLVGHYDKDVMVATERYLDDKLSGRLSELHRMELYPGPLKTATVVLNENEVGRQFKHPGAIIAGLGTVGDLTPGRLASTLEHALAVYGAECVGHERRRRQRERLAESAERIPISVTAVLVGSGEGGVTLSDSILALLRGVSGANARLGAAGRRSTAAGVVEALSAFIGSVDIFELNEDRAIEAVYALREVSRSVELRRFVPSHHLECGEEGLRRVRFDVAQAWWQRLRVKEENEGLVFEAPTQSSRVPSRLNSTQRGLVEGFVERAISSTSLDPNLGCTLFELLIPNAFKAYAPDRRNLILDLDSESAKLPWELLRDRYDKEGQPMSVSSGMVRQLRGLQGREQVLRAVEATALVVGNPVVTDRRTFPALQGAEEEADAVGRRLTAGGYTVTSLLRNDATPFLVLSAIHERPWRILHLAGHGVFEYAPIAGGRTYSGLVLDNNMFFTASEADQMRFVPELVFINCCHLGQTKHDTPFHRLAANLSTQFIEMGARAVVAAGWAVDDAAAKTFSMTFYDEMLSGRNFGDAVCEARRQVYRSHGGTNTWGAYQCYGDPAFSLKAAATTPSTQNWAAPAEVTAWASGFEARVRDADAAMRKRMSDELENGLAIVPASWLKDAKLLAAVGLAFGALGHFKRAVEHLKQIRTMERPDAPVRALEWLVNMSVRHAWKVARVKGKAAKKKDGSERAQKEKERRARRDALAELADAEALLSQLMAVGKTAERFSLKGSLHKRRAMIDPRVRRRELTAMIAAYAKGDELAKASGAGPTGRVYPLTNQAAAETMLGWLGRPTGRAKAASAFKELKEVAEQLESGTKFFELAARADVVLLKNLEAKGLPATAVDEIVEAYAAAGQRGVLPKHKESLLEQMEFYKMMCDSLPKPAGESMRQQLEVLSTALSTRL